MDYLALDDRGLRGQGTCIKHSKFSICEINGSSQGDASETATEESPSWEDYVSTLLSEHAHQDLDLTTPLTEEEIASLPLLATHLVLSSGDPLKALSHLSQNFPKHATSLARRWDTKRTEELSSKLEDIEAEIQANMHMVSGVSNMVWMNGVALSDADMNPFRWAYKTIAIKPASFEKLTHLQPSSTAPSRAPNYELAHENQFDFRAGGSRPD
jgi:UDP-glucose:glycoprotein glucosyltransferase